MNQPETITAKEYQPAPEIIERYAEVILASIRSTDEQGNVVNGVQAGDRVVMYLPEEASALGEAVMKKSQELKAIPVLLPDSLILALLRYEKQDQEQRELFATQMLSLLANSQDHFVDITVIRDYTGRDKESVSAAVSMGVSMRKIFLGATTDPKQQVQSRVKIYWPTQYLADQNNTTLEEIWADFIAGLYLDDENFLQKMAESDVAVKLNTERLNNLQIHQLSIVSDDGDTNLTFSLAQDSCWVGASGANRPSYESFTAVHRDSANGHITFDVPIKTGDTTFTKLKIYYKNGQAVKIEGPDGTEDHPESEMFRDIMTEYSNFDRLGEFALTPLSLSKLTKGYGIVMLTENLGGTCHFAHGSAYQKNYAGVGPLPVSDQEWEGLGYNRCDRHLDMVRMGNFTITASLEDGSKKTIFKDGDFTFSEI